VEHAYTAVISTVQLMHLNLWRNAAAPTARQGLQLQHQVHPFDNMHTSCSVSVTTAAHHITYWQDYIANQQHIIHMDNCHNKGRHHLKVSSLGACCVP